MSLCGSMFLHYLSKRFMQLSRVTKGENPEIQNAVFLKRRDVMELETFKNLYF